MTYSISNFNILFLQFIIRLNITEYNMKILDQNVLQLINSYFKLCWQIYQKGNSWNRLLKMIRKTVVSQSNLLGDCHDCSEDMRNKKIISISTSMF